MISSASININKFAYFCVFLLFHRKAGRREKDAPRPALGLWRCFRIGGICGFSEILRHHMAVVIGFQDFRRVGELGIYFIHHIFGVVLFDGLSLFRGELSGRCVIAALIR